MTSLQQALASILDLAKRNLLVSEHNHALLHAILRRQGATAEQIYQLIASHGNAEEFARLVATLDKPTADLAAAVKANQ